MLNETSHISIKQIDEVVELVGLTSVTSKRAGRFSLGMCQRLGNAAAFSIDQWRHFRDKLNHWCSSRTESGDSEDLTSG